MNWLKSLFARVVAWFRSANGGAAHGAGQEQSPHAAYGTEPSRAAQQTIQEPTQRPFSESDSGVPKPPSPPPRPPPPPPPEPPRPSAGDSTEKLNRHERRRLAAWERERRKHD